MVVAQSGWGSESVFEWGSGLGSEGASGSGSGSGSENDVYLSLSLPLSLSHSIRSHDDMTVAQLKGLIRQVAIVPPSRSFAP